MSRRQRRRTKCNEKPKPLGDSSPRFAKFGKVSEVVCEPGKIERPGHPFEFGNLTRRIDFEAPGHWEILRKSKRLSAEVHDVLRWCAIWGATTCCYENEYVPYSEERNKQ